mmetsp:Transcript_645/g.894  ORF Transcript_645/g.894 Transcript_645/m.894 type:complete len:130 (+) Transcript_645:89-478(+)|eukprot:CAMPEP_0202458106 /NCGR_PEP_ID=MMETSP1360-20130828/21469_1 /ASSEMBLY_ACC=CAM_ASM_000848 /TAXON_ID=515479 /ORGANISM="Licmophora paradoxa, Strain CCMP2313" /LENGTH=129 /DNA_ID=CAMNT_0049078479 /DNA_START=85 /DNA_END=474 /DNA_ORIENTATION=-
MCVISREEFPIELLNGIHWVFHGTYDDRAIFKFQVADLMRDMDVFSYAKWRPELLPLKRVPCIRVCLNNSDKYYEIQPFSEEGFTNCDLLYALHDIFTPELKGKGKYFLKGLILKSSGGGIPCYQCIVH